MPLKFTMLMHTQTTKSGGGIGRIAGFSETVYLDESTISDEFLALSHTLCQKRAQLLPTNSAIVGSRVSIIGSTKRSRTFDNNYPGRPATPCAVPQKALKVTLTAKQPDNNQREYYLHSVPDARVVTGEYVSSQQYDAAMAAYFQELHDHWGFYGYDRNAPKSRLVRVNTSGTVEVGVGEAAPVLGTSYRIIGTQQNRPFVVFSDRMKLITGDPDPVLSPRPTLTAPVLFDEAFLVTNVKKFLPFYFSAPQSLPPRAVIRKVGEPFNQYRGRALTRR